MSLVDAVAWKKEHEVAYPHGEVDLTKFSTGQPRKGDWMQCYPSNCAYWPADPRPDEVDVHDVAHHLSMLCRYTGAAKFFYSVAEHSVIVSREVEKWAKFSLDIHWKQLALQGLLHDGHEAYVNDLARPTKASIPDYNAIERLNEIALRDHFGLPHDLHSIVKEIDRRMLRTEKQYILGPSPRPWGVGLGEPLEGVKLFGWSPAIAEAEFLARYYELVGNAS